MNVSRAKELSHIADFVKGPFDRIVTAIEDAATSGKWSIEFCLGTSQEAYALQKKLKRLGYKVTVSSQQISPNDSDYYLSINWEDANPE